MIQGAVTAAIDSVLSMFATEYYFCELYGSSEVIIEGQPGEDGQILLGHPIYWLSISARNPASAPCPPKLSLSNDATGQTTRWK